jgi:uncharacterized protein YidB (DUF937 family)
MGLLDGMLGQVVGQVLGGGQTAGQGGNNPLMGIVMSLIQQNGGLGGLLQKFQQAGLSEQAASWVSTGANQPVDASQIGAALGGSDLGALAAKFGLSTDQVSGSLAEMLPQVIDKLTPNGKVEHEGVSMDSLAGMLGGLLKG